MLVSADVRTMLVHCNEFAAIHESPGLILIPPFRSIASVIEGLLLVWVEWAQSQMQNQAVRLPSSSRWQR